MQRSTARSRCVDGTEVLPSSVACFASDTFRAELRRTYTLDKQLLGGRFHFESNSTALLTLVEAAFGEVPPHRLAESAEFRIELTLLVRADVMTQ